MNATTKTVWYLLPMCHMRPGEPGTLRFASREEALAKRATGWDGVIVPVEE